MITITYIINSGNLPITVKIPDSGVSLQDLVFQHK